MGTKNKPLVDRSENLKHDLTKRLNRVEGQIRGINGMVDKESYCDDILTQISAAKSALNSISKILLEHHMKGCLSDDIKNGRSEVIDELVITIGKIIK
ncbi:MAG: metal-sensing transcriptional repressor [Culicoidibacterales bacterium]